MGRSISPLLRRELANLDNAGSRHSAMKALKSYVRDQDAKAIPHFLAEVSETKEPGSSSGECTISHYEVLARVHGPKIVPQIDNIMSTIMRTLSSSAGSFPLHQACSRVVPAIARFAIEPSTPGEEKTQIIHSLYKPLCDALMALQESVSSGAALCLKAVVQADNWRFASDAMVNEICIKVASALEEKVTQTNYHMGLVMALVKLNTLIAEAYARSFLRSGLGILSTGITESNTQKRLSAIQMINSLLHCVDPRSISSELDKVFDVMEKCKTDQFHFVRVAAWETLQIAKAIASQKGFDRRNGKSTPGAPETDLEQHMNDEQREVFAGFGQSRAAGDGRRNNTSSPPPQRPQSQLTRKLVRSLQEPTYSNSRDSICSSPTLDEVEQNTKVATSIIAITESDHSAPEPPPKGPVATMGRRISPLLRREVANLDDAGSRHSPMKALKSYVWDLDSKAIPHFLAEVSETKESGSSPGECTISHYEVLARVHGPKIVPQVDSIMSTIMRTLSSSAGSFPLHQACSRVVPAVARYAIEPSTPGEEKTRIIHSLYKPLCDALMGLQESVSCGAALCLKAVVQADNWRFASDDMVNKICLKVASALEEKATQTDYHMGLVMALVKHNTLIAEAYARYFLRSGLGILSTGITESNTQKRLSTIQMIKSLLRCVDSRSISSELEKVFAAMEKCRTDQFQSVRVAAWETLQIARAIASQKGFDRRNGKSTQGATDHVFAESPKSIGKSSSNFEYARRTDRRLWDGGNGGVDVSLKDGICLRSSSRGKNSETDLEQHMNDEQREAFAGFGQSRAASEG